MNYAVKNYTIDSNFKAVSNLILDNSRVIEIGRRQGNLFSFLKSRKNIELDWFELDDGCVLESQLQFYLDKSFDYAIFDLDLQKISDPIEVFKAVARISRAVIFLISNSKNNFSSYKKFEIFCKENGFTVEQRLFFYGKFSFPLLFKSRILIDFFTQYGIFLVCDNNPTLTFQEEFVFKRDLANKINRIYQVAKTTAFSRD